MGRDGMGGAGSAVRVRVRVCCVHVEVGSNVAIMLKDVHEQLNEQVPCPRTPPPPPCFRLTHSSWQQGPPPL